MADVLALATGKTYDLVCETGVTAHPAVAPYPKDIAPYVAPIMPGGVIETIFEVIETVECLPENIHDCKSRINEEDYKRLISYCEKRLATFGFGKKDTDYRFYILKKYATVEQPFEKKNIQVSVRLDLNDIPLVRSGKIYSSYSWDVRNNSCATRECDKSFFDYNGMAIPKGIRWFFEIEELVPGDKKDIKLLYAGKTYDGYFTVDKYDRVRMFWDRLLGMKITAFKEVSPVPLALYNKVSDDLYTLDILVGSEKQAFEKRTEWIVPCNAKTYDCARAFNELITVDWHQSRQLAKAAVNDIVYIYSSTPIKAITYQCVVNKVQVPSLEIPDAMYYADQTMATEDGPFIELQCIREFDALDGLRLEELRTHGINGNIQGPLKVGEDLSRHLADMIAEQNTIDRMTGSNMKFIGPMNDRIIDSAVDEETATTLSDEALQQVAKKKESSTVKTRTVTAEQKQRDPYIAEYAKRRANGICQLCGSSAPFTDSKGNPYLESHHIIWLANGGADSIENTVALCPNCHRKMHVVKDASDVAFLKEKNTDKS